MAVRGPAFAASRGDFVPKCPATGPEMAFAGPIHDAPEYVMET